MKNSIRKEKKNIKNNIPLPLLIGAAVMVILCFFAMLYIRNPASFSELYSFFGLVPGNQVHRSEDYDGVSVSFLYVGQGDCIFINDGESKVLIDTGVFAAYSDIEKFLLAGGVEKLDYLIITHPHSDHVGSAASVLRHFKVDNVVMDSFDESLMPTSSSFNTFLSDLDGKSSEISFITARNGQVIPLEHGEIRVLSNGGYSDLNNSSLVLQYSYGSVSFLLCGDIEKEAENDLLAKNVFSGCTVLKAAHHGSSSGTSEALLKEVKPEYVVVSCGIDNEFGFPKDSFIKRVEDSKARMLRTDTDGNITFITNGYSVTDVVTHSCGPAGNAEEYGAGE